MTHDHGVPRPSAEPTGVRHQGARLAAELRGALAWPAIGKGVAPELESARSHQSDVVALMRAQVRATDELPYRLSGVRRPRLSGVYVRQLPHFKYDLYERYLGYALTSAVRHPDWRAVTTELAELTGGSGHALNYPVTLEALLQHLAAIQVSSDTPLTVAADEWLAGNTVPGRRRPPEWPAIVESLLTRSGLLVRSGSSSNERAQKGSA